MAQRVNLDAMIRREDLDITDKDPAQIGIGTQLKLFELEQASTTFHILRKPDFQRETSNWEPEKIVDMVASFLDGDLIPSVIVWRSNRSGKLFVIDGAHRLSALIAWINDDYGDTGLSRAFYGEAIDENQIKVARKTRDLIAKIGTYQHLKDYAIKPEGAPDALAILRARNQGALSIMLQDVRGDVARAEKSFLKINQSATPIDPTELIIIEARRKPNAIAARALLRAGTGHPYWGGFTVEQNKINVTVLAKSIYDNLFKPIIQYPIRTLTLPAAGHALTPDSLDLIFNLVNHVNSAFDGSKKKNEAKWKIKTAGSITDADLADDASGELTLKFLKTVESATSRVFGPASGSLGLHPGVYCYGATGRFQPTAFLVLSSWLSI